MGKRKSKKRSNSTLKVTSYFKRFQVKFARRRAGACRNPSRAGIALGFSRTIARPSVATALTLGATLITKDDKIRSYEHVKAAW